MSIYVKPHEKKGIMGEKGWKRRPTRVKRYVQKKVKYMETKIWE